MKKIWIIIIITVLILGAITGGIFLLLKNKPTATPDIPDNPASQICQKIKQKDAQYSCLARVNNDEKYCDQLDNNPQNICLAILQKDSTYCQNIARDNRQYCYQNLVSASGQADFCDQLIDPKEISACYVHFVSTNYFASNLSAINQSMCDKVLKDQPEHDICLAMTTQNASACEPARTDCLAFITKDISLCPKSASKTDENECYHGLAMLNKDSKICEKITDTSAKDDCYQDYSRLTADETLCISISNSNQKDQCLSNVALNISENYPIK